MKTDTMPAQQIAVPVGVDDRPHENEIDNNVLEASMAAFNAGMLCEEDFQAPPQPRQWTEGEAVLVFPDELPTELESDAPQVELLLDMGGAERLLDSCDPDWRRYGRPPSIHTQGRGWFATRFSEYELRTWISRKSQRR
jgi:hypothetical protein